ncbi:MAG: hypothetical protein GY940_47590 [bacterium]|nr:hypothetical protein [bacterium]
MARLLDIAFHVLYVTLPKEMRDGKEEDQLNRRRQIVADFEGIYKKTIDYNVLEGNPIRKTLAYLEPLQNHILVVTANPEAPSSIFKPNVPYLLAKKSRLSTLVIPGTNTDE